MDFDWTVKITDIVMILAVLIGPIIAVQLTRYLDNKKEQHERKLQVFKTLMETRAYNVSWNHVAALNRIDVEFYKDKKVLAAWKEYLDLLGIKGMETNLWVSKRIDLFIELLYTMGQSLNYDFDKTHIKNSSYSPIAHGTFNDEQQVKDDLKLIRENALKMLTGEIPVQMEITNWPNPPKN